ncbi:MAG: LLM class flavin-dependent oxidoreductase [Gammaproteobacteria bacterium]|nr:LLM class flavin-dependent oxidoreductase [Gammaproteobacteria bacterium]
MKFGISLPNNHGVASIRDLVGLAVRAEQLGFASVWVSEHLFHSSYVAERLGDKPYHEALTVLTAVACATEKVRLGTSVLVLPWHHPVRLAKQVASLDELSGGRVDLGLGVAQTDDEYRNLGVPFNRRGRIADEMLDAMRALWSQDIPKFEGEFFNFKELRFEPKPVQNPLPILIGGNSAVAMNRVRVRGNGWHALSQSPEQMRAGIETIGGAGLRHSVRTMLSMVDEPWSRPVTERRTMKGTSEELVAMAQAYADVGVEEIIIDGNTGDIDAATALFEQFKRDVIDALD